MWDVSSDDARDHDEYTEATAPLDPLELAALRTVEAAASLYWQSLPDKPDMAVPVSQEGINAVQRALNAVQTGDARSPEVRKRLDTFENVLHWATASRFSGSLASPIGAGFLAVALVAVSLDETRLPGTQSRLLLVAGALALQALLFPIVARQPQFKLNALFLTGSKSRDQRFVHWLLTKGALIYTPVAAIRALIYGALIPFSIARHIMRRGQFAAVAALFAVHLALIAFAMNIPDG